MSKTYQRNRNERINARATKQEKELVEKQAKKNGMSVTDYLIWLVYQDAEGGSK
jgi:uncharacterized protein (DUF1778 family)